MGNSQSIKKINFEDIQYIIKLPERHIMINTLPISEQDCLLPNTMNIHKEEELKSILPPITEIMDLSSNTKATTNSIDKSEIEGIKEAILIINTKMTRIEEEMKRHFAH